MASSKVDLTENGDFKDKKHTEFIPNRNLVERYTKNEGITNEEWEVMNAYMKVFGVNYHINSYDEVFKTDNPNVCEDRMCISCGKLMRTPWERFDVCCCRKCYLSGKWDTVQRTSSNNDARRILNLR